MWRSFGWSSKGSTRAKGRQRHSYDDNDQRDRDDELGDSRSAASLAHAEQEVGVVYEGSVKSTGLSCPLYGRWRLYGITQCWDVKAVKGVRFAYKPTPQTLELLATFREMVNEAIRICLVEKLEGG